MIEYTHNPSFWRIYPPHTVIEFSVKHMLIFTVKGRFSVMEGEIDGDIEKEPENTKVRANIVVASIDAGNQERNDYLKNEIFNVDAYPFIQFESTRIEWLDGSRYQIAGALAMRDVTRPIILDALFGGYTQGHNGRSFVGFTATTQLDRHVWGIEWNQATERSGIIGDTIDITLQVAATDR